MFCLTAIQQVAMARTCVFLDALAANPPRQPVNEAAVGLLFSEVYGRGIKDGDVDFDEIFREDAVDLAADIDETGRPTPALLRETACNLRGLLTGSQRRQVQRGQVQEGEEINLPGLTSGILRGDLPRSQGGREGEVPTALPLEGALLAPTIDPVRARLVAGLKRLEKAYGGGDLTGADIIERAAKGRPVDLHVEEVERMRQVLPADALFASSPSTISQFGLAILLGKLNNNDERARDYLERHLSVLLDRAGREAEILWELAQIYRCLKIRGLLRGLQALPLHPEVIREFEKEFTALASLQVLAACGNLQAEALLRKLGSKKGSVAAEFLETLPIHQLAFRYVGVRNIYDLLALTELANAGDKEAQFCLEMVTDKSG